MERIDSLINMAREQEKLMYIRGISPSGILLGIYMDTIGVHFEGYVDKQSDKCGKTVYGEHICYAPSEVPANAFVFVAVYSDKNQQKIGQELQQMGIEYADNLWEELYEYAESIDDEYFLRAMFSAKLGYTLNLEKPKTLCEKLQWLKLYDRNPRYTQLVDKYEFKKYVAGLLGEQYVFPNCCEGAWNSFDDIEFDKLPNQFVLKCTHDSGSIMVVKDKTKIDKEEIRKKLEKALGVNYFNIFREWTYKNVKPRIIAEKYFDCLGKPESLEYKVTCFNGKVGFVTICQGIAHSTYDVRTNDSYDVNFNHMPWYAYYKNSVSGFCKPEQWDELIMVCEKLAVNIPYVRVDCYIIEGQIYIGEMTFYTWAGFIEFTPPEWDLKLGECLELPLAEK